jgi:hypothetical protein
MKTTTPAFKVGDKVRCIKSPGTSSLYYKITGEIPQVGKEYTIKDTFPTWDGSPSLILFGALIESTVFPGDMCGWKVCNFEKVEFIPEPIDPAMLKEALELINLY